jgi:sugar-specific transcriptional regulator TrmB
MIDLGISEKEARIYSALLQKKELSAMEIQEIAHVPRTKVYEFTHKMIAKNMCIEKHVGAKRKYQAVEPKKFLQNLLKTQEQEVSEKKRLVRELEQMTAPLYNHSSRSTELSENIEIIKNLASIHERYLSFVRMVKKDIVGLVKPPYAHQYNQEKLHEQDETLFAKLKKGLRVRLVYEKPSADKMEWLCSYISQCVRAGEQARVIEKLPMKVYIFDQRYILLMLANVKTEVSPLTMFVVDHSPLASLGIALFDALWKQAQDYRVLQTLIKR